MAIAAVLHGAALKNALSHQAYASRYGSENPNLDLLMELHQAGVLFYACGQSMGFSGISKSELASLVKVAFSAMTMMRVFYDVSVDKRQIKYYELTQICNELCGAVSRVCEDRYTVARGF